MWWQLAFPYHRPLFLPFTRLTVVACPRVSTVLRPTTSRSLRHFRQPLLRRSTSLLRASPVPLPFLIPSRAMSQSTSLAVLEEEPPASFTPTPFRARYPSALLLNFPFHPIPAANTAASSSSSSSSSSAASQSPSASDLSLAVIDAAVSAVRQRLYVHLTADDWSTITVAQMQQRLAAIYQRASEANAKVDTVVLLPSTLSPSPSTAPASLSLTYLADSHAHLGRTLQHTVTLPPSTSVLLSCDFTTVALSTAVTIVNPTKSRKKREEAKAAAPVDAPKKKRRTTAEIRAENDKIAARISELISHVDRIGGIHVPALLGTGVPSPFAARSALYPPLSVLLKDEEKDAFELGPVYNIDWLHPTAESTSGVAVPTFGSQATAPGEGEEAQARFASFEHVVLGGTFDHFHVGHKLLLSTAAFLSASTVLVGVTAPSMLHKKTLEQLIEPSLTRQQAVQQFLSAVRPELSLEVVEISTPEGPTLERADLSCIVASEETVKGAKSINEKRQKQSPPLPPMRIVQLPMFALPAVPAASAPSSSPSPASLLSMDKLSSTAFRLSELSTYLGRSHSHPWAHPASSSLHSCYVVGLTGGIGSGKSSISGHLARLGARVIDCDVIGHSCYAKGEPAYDAIVEHFGATVLAADGAIDRKVLGPRVFKDPLEMQRLNAIVWPEIKRKAAEQVRGFQAGEVVVMEAAVLMEAGWSEDDSLVDEVWVTFVDKKEAVQRVVQRNKVAEDEAERRVSSQMANEERIFRADVLLTTLFAKEVTQAMCKEAWEALQERVADRQRSLSGMGIRERWEWVVRRMYRRKPPKKPVKARVDLTEDAADESKESKDDGEEGEEEPEWTPVKARGPRRRGGVKKEAMEDDGEGEEEVKVKREEGVDGDSMVVDAGDEDVVEMPASELDAVLVRWWSVLPHSEAMDDLRAFMFRVFDQRRPELQFPEEVSASAHSRRCSPFHPCLHPLSLTTCCVFRLLLCAGVAGYLLPPMRGACKDGGQLLVRRESGGSGWRAQGGWRCGSHLWRRFEGVRAVLLLRLCALAYQQR